MKVSDMTGHEKAHECFRLVLSALVLIPLLNIEIRTLHDDPPLD